MRRDRRVGARVLRAGLGPEVDVLEHEGAEREHRGADLVALDDVAGRTGVLDEVVDERVDALRAGRAECLDLAARQVALLEDAVANRVVDVVVDVGDAVDDANDLALERLRLARAGVGQDAVDDLVGQVEAACDPRRTARCGGNRRRRAGRARPRRRGRTAGDPCRGRARSPRRDPRSAAALGRRHARSRSSRACASSACGSGRRRGR